MSSMHAEMLTKLNNRSSSTTPAASAAATPVSGAAYLPRGVAAAAVAMANSKTRFDQANDKTIFEQNVSKNGFSKAALEFMNGAGRECTHPHLAWYMHLNHKNPCTDYLEEINFMFTNQDANVTPAKVLKLVHEQARLASVAAAAASRTAHTVATRPAISLY